MTLIHLVMKVVQVGREPNVFPLWMVHAKVLARPIVVFVYARAKIETKS